jgi:lipoate-protein ligase A
MFLLDHSWPTPEENLAWDEALIEFSESRSSEFATGGTGEALRLWQMPSPCVVVGRSSRLAEEVYVERCLEDEFPVLRRMSGGASIVAGPGCLMYSVLLSLDARPECRALDRTHRTVMEKSRSAVCHALRSVGSTCQVEIRGICDLTCNGQKISGNSLRVKKHWLMYHGTLLIDMPLHWIDHYLKMPPKQPEYRDGRPHRAFVASLQDVIGDSENFASILKRCLAMEWQAERPWSHHPLAHGMEGQLAHWLAHRYDDPKWHESR